MSLSFRVPSLTSALLIVSFWIWALVTRLPATAPPPAVRVKATTPAAIMIAGALPGEDLMGEQ
jgi:hypothetical protein